MVCLTQDSHRASHLPSSLPMLVKRAKHATQNAPKNVGRDEMCGHFMGIYWASDSQKWGVAINRRVLRSIAPFFQRKPRFRPAVIILVFTLFPAVLQCLCWQNDGNGWETLGNAGKGQPRLCKNCANLHQTEHEDPESRCKPIRYGLPHRVWIHADQSAQTDGSDKMEILHLSALFVLWRGANVTGKEGRNGIQCG